MLDQVFPAPISVIIRYKSYNYVCHAVHYLLFYLQTNDSVGFNKEVGVYRTGVAVV